MASKNQSISGIWTWLGVVGFVVLLMACAAMIYPARRQYARQLEFYEQVRSEADRKRSVRDALQKEVSDLQTSPAAIEKVARETFRFCRDGEVIVYHELPAKGKR